MRTAVDRTELEVLGRKCCRQLGHNGHGIVAIDAHRPCRCLAVVADRIDMEFARRVFLRHVKRFLVVLHVGRPIRTYEPDVHPRRSIGRKHEGMRLVPASKIPDDTAVSVNRLHNGDDREVAAAAAEIAAPRRRAGFKLIRLASRSRIGIDPTVVGFAAERERLLADRRKHPVERVPVSRHDLVLIRRSGNGAEHTHRRGTRRGELTELAHLLILFWIVKTHPT